ncbi:MAG: phosphoribosylformylglycinamidine synthase I, partial [Porphyrobacter sp. HL-46]
MATPAN